jgi:hypothetical protein
LCQANTIFIKCLRLRPGETEKNRENASFDISKSLQQDFMHNPPMFTTLLAASTSRLLSGLAPLEQFRPAIRVSLNIGIFEN